MGIPTCYSRGKKERGRNMASEENIRVPEPMSGGILLSYNCSAACKHCMYACSRAWRGDWITEDDLYLLLRNIAPYIQTSPFGEEAFSLNYGLHFTGGEPFLNFPLLLKGVEMATSLGISGLFVETNCSWATSDELTLERLQLLKGEGLNSILISVNPFYLEFVPFERTERVVNISRKVFSNHMMVYQPAYYNRFLQMGIKGTMPLSEYLEVEDELEFGRQVEFFLSGRAPYALEQYGLFPQYRAHYYFDYPCVPSFLRPWHNHFDNYGNYMPGYCGGISFGDFRLLDELLEAGLPPSQYPILDFIVKNDFRTLFNFALSYGYEEREEGYLSKCHLCLDIRRFLVSRDSFEELQPVEFYSHIEDER
jgi:hypothetical protein